MVFLGVVGGGLAEARAASAAAVGAGEDAWVAAPVEVLAAALEEAGWEPAEAWCGPGGAPAAAVAEVGRGGHGLVWRAAGDEDAVGGSVLVARPRGGSLHGLPLWELRGLVCGEDGDCEVASPAREAGGAPGLAATLSAGIAVRHARTGLGPPVWALAHAAGEIEEVLAGTEAPAGSAPAACMSPRMPQLAPLAEPLGRHVVWRVDGASRCVALTFDACSTLDWGPLNAEVLAVLRRLRVPATLFLGGHWAELHPEAVRDVAGDPLFEIGTHTYSHPHPRELDAAALRQQVLWGQWAVFSRSGVLPRLLRLPYAEIDEPTFRRVARLGLEVVQYDLPAGDADLHVSAERLVGWVGERAHAGSIVILHMNRPGNQTAQALPGIVARLAARGLRPCTVSAMRQERDLL